MDLYTVKNNIISGKQLQDLNLRVVFYARVSTDKDEQMHSLNSQVKFFEEYIGKNPNWEYKGKYIDEGITGTSALKRGAFLKMISDSKLNKFDLILTKEISRFSRNTLDSIKYTQELLSSGVGVYFLNDNINTILPDSEFRLTIMASVAQDEVRKLSERVRFGMRRSIDSGVVLGCSNIYGYVKDKGKLIIDEKQAEMVRLIYDKYANTNVGLLKISKDLYSLGYTTKKGKRLDTTIITRIIENPKYKGYYCGNKSRIIDYRTKKKKKLSSDEWVMYKDEETVPPIVSEELWEKANGKLKIRQDSFTNKVSNKAIFQNRYTYSGKIYCGKHFETYHRSSSDKRKNNPVWECQVYRRDGIKGCDNPRIFEYELDLVFENIINKLFNDRKVIFDSILENCKNYYNENSSEVEIKVLKNKCDEISKKKDKLLELVMAGYLENADYKKQVDNLNKNLRELIDEINLLDANREDPLYIKNQITNLKTNLMKSINDKQCFSDIVNSLIDKIIVYKENSENKKIKLDILFKTNESINIYSDNSGKKFHLLDPYTANNSSLSCN